MTNAAIRTLTPLWRGHVNALGCFDAALTQDLFDRLCASYSQIYRAYHTLDHLIQVFEKLEHNADRIGDPLRLAFATWYHDIVYDPRATDNEERSAEAARMDLKSMHADAVFIDRVTRLILATKSHAKGGVDNDDDLFLDCDYSILGSEPEAYKIYAGQARREYAHLTNAEWQRGRTAFLTHAAAQPRTFRTIAFENLYGTKARTNMMVELASLAHP